MTTDYRLNCWEQQARVLLAQWNAELLDVFPMFWKSPISSQEGASSVGAQLRAVNYDIVKDISDILGVDITEYAPASLTDLLTFIVSELSEGHKILAFANAFYCPWSPAYRAYHNSHFVIVRDVDINRGVLTIDDAYHGGTSIRFEIDAFRKAYGTAFSFRKSNTTVTPQPDLSARLAIAASQSVRDYGRSPGDISRHLLSSLETFCYHQEIRGYDRNWWSAPVFAKLIKIENTHWNIATFFEAADPDRAKQFRDLSKDWGRLKLLLMACQTSSFAPRMSKSAAKIVARIEELSQQILGALPSADEPAPLPAAPITDHAMGVDLFDSGGNTGFDFALDRAEVRKTLSIGGQPVDFGLNWHIKGRPNCFQAANQTVALSPSKSKALHILYTRMEVTVPSILRLETSIQSYTRTTTSNTIFVQTDARTPAVFSLQAYNKSPIKTDCLTKMAYLYVMTFELDRHEAPRELVFPADPNLLVFGAAVN